MIQEITAEFDTDGSAQENKKIAEALRKARLALVQAAQPVPAEPHGEARSEGGRRQ